MKRKLALLMLLPFAFIFFQAAIPEDTPGEPEVIDEYEENPPIADSFWVQKMEVPLSDGSNMIIMVKFNSEFPPAANFIDARYGDNQFIKFTDNGLGVDAVSGDKIYSAAVVEDITAFTDKVQEYIANIATLNEYIQFNGHLGAVSAAPVFDQDGFNHNVVVQFDPHIFDGATCGDDLKKERSLFITSLDVVEDPARTFNIVSGTGNANGAWTFGYMIKGIVNSSTTNAKRNFLKNWLKTWTNTQTVNGQTIDTRTDIVPLLIAPWIQKARNNPSLSIDINNWETEWDNSSEELLVQYAPFKLTAIVNRLDLRGSGSYVNGVKDAGETRFIFTLVAPYEVNGGHNLGGYDAGGIPVQFGQDVNMPPPGNSFVDWEGMNVIFEYGNVQTSHCALKNFAMDWLDLSGYTPNSNDFKNKLEYITHTVTDANAVPGNVNGSALRRMRTNERIFDPVTTKDVNGWVRSDWEFRQFELNASTHQLQMVPLTNTPRNLYNFAENIGVAGHNTGGDNYATLSSYNGIDVSRPHADTLLRWVRENKLKLHMGKYTLPTTFGVMSDNYLLAGAARANGDYAHYFGFDWAEMQLHYTGGNTIGQYEKDMRRQLSLNTCQGCHNGETKTFFTHVLPQAYGEEADYTGTTPGNVFRNFDGRFFDNIGYTDPNHDDNYVNPGTSKQYIPKVSAFLTGRDYKGTTDFYKDDDLTDVDDKQFGAGLFVVNDPNNHANTDLAPSNVHYGYNDLERRKIDICSFIKIQCATGEGSPGKVMQTIKGLSFQPFVDGAH